MTCNSLNCALNLYLRDGTLLFVSTIEYEGLQPLRLTTRTNLTVFTPLKVPLSCNGLGSFQITDSLPTYHNIPCHVEFLRSLVRVTNGMVPSEVSSWPYYCRAINYHNCNMNARVAREVWVRLSKCRATSGRSLVAGSSDWLKHPGACSDGFPTETIDRPLGIVTRRRMTVVV